ncbi:MAG: MBL fold metallo-hydrolase, partial [Cyanobacteria bacterium J06626_26]
MSDSNTQFTIHFWGVRGSIPCPGAETVRYGGNTSCIEMRVNGERLIFD